METKFSIEHKNRPDWDFLEDNPVLKPYKNEFDSSLDESLSVGFDVGKMFVYLACMYDRGSSSRDMENYRDRISYSAGEAGFEQRNGGYPEWVSQILNGHPFVERCASRMLYVQHSNDFAMLCSFQDALYRLMSEVSAGDTSKVKETMALKKQIDEILEKINNGPVNARRAEHLYGLIEETSLGIRPEDHIKTFEKSKSVFPELAQ